MTGATRFVLDCVNVIGQFPHHIALPFPTLPAQQEGQRASASENEHIFFACPECKYVARYTQQDRKAHLVHLQGGAELPPDPIAVRVDFVCAEQGCKAPIRLHTTRLPSETRDQVIQRLEIGVYHRTCVCAKDHKIHLPRRHPVTYDEGQNCCPFYLVYLANSH